MLPTILINYLLIYVSVLSATVSPSPRATGSIKTRPTIVYRPRSLALLHRARLRSLQLSECDEERVEWDPIEVPGPHTEDRHTLAQLARMSGNAYALPGQGNWYEVDPAWNVSFPFGWEESEGFRGHVFLSSDNTTIILSIKGTTLQGSTSKLDKFNDNLLFSCCCARVDISWIFRTVCDCYANRWRCDDQCLTDALVQDSLFYSIGVKLIDDLIRIYPTANIWLVGHSLGGALASLLGATYGLPAVAFESPGERLAATRLHLPIPPSEPPSPNSSQYPNIFDHQQIPLRFPSPRQPLPGPPLHPLSRSITHVYHTADPIPQGACTGLYSPCTSAGYALETRCHLGKTIIFDTVDKMGWTVDIRRHVIKEVVGVLESDVDWAEGEGNEENLDEGQIAQLQRFERSEKAMGWPDWKEWLKKSIGSGKHNKGNKGGDPEDKGRVQRVPKPIIEEDCVDCHKWEFGNFKDD